MISIVRAPDFYAAPQGVAPADPVKLRDFLQFLVSHPPLQGKIDAVEPWNEQNLSWEWGGARLWPNAPASPPQGVLDFVQLQKAAYQGVKAGDARVTVVLPALTPTGVGECWRNEEVRTQRFCLDAVRLAIDDVLYLEFLYGVNNGEIKQYYDVLGVHPSGYNNPPDDFLDRNSLPLSNPASGRYKGHGSFYLKRYRQLRAVQERHGDTRPVWITEMGWSSTRRPVPGYEFGIDNTEEQRGRYVARMMEILNAEAPFVTHVFLWNLNWRTFAPETDERYGFGILDNNGAPLPALRVPRTTCATRGGLPGRSAGPERRPHGLDRLRVLQSGGVPQLGAPAGHHPDQAAHHFGIARLGQLGGEQHPARSQRPPQLGHYPLRQLLCQSRARRLLRPQDTEQVDLLTLHRVGHAHRRRLGHGRMPGHGGPPPRPGPGACRPP